jgi:hypothetical protein
MWYVADTGPEGELAALMEAPADTSHIDGKKK